MRPNKKKENTIELQTDLINENNNFEEFYYYNLRYFY